MKKAKRSVSRHIRGSGAVGEATSGGKQTFSLTKQRQLKEKSERAREAALRHLNARQRNILEDLAPGNQDANGPDIYVDVPMGEDINPGEDDGIPEDPAVDEAYSNYIRLVQGNAYVATIAEWESSRLEAMRREQKRMESWEAQMPDLVRELLAWRHSGKHVEPPEPDDLLPTGWLVDMWSLHGREPRFPIPHYADTARPNCALIRHGLLSNAPERPTVAFSILTLETYLCLRRRKPSFGIQAFVRTICDTNLLLCRPIYIRQFTEAFDIYLAILRAIDKKVSVALGQDADDWRIKNCCPACMHRVEDEPSLPYDLLLSIDGGNSLKRFSTPGTPLREFSSDYILPRDTVNAMADEVVHRVRKSKPGKRKRRKAADGDSIDVAMELGEKSADEEDDDDDDDVAQPDEIMKAGDISAADAAVDRISVCVERWKANAEESKKGMFSCFDETGIFICICRHGFVLLVVDMISSGELAKYPLAILKKLQDVHPGLKLIAYDIGCAFKKTAANSSFGDQLSARFLVPAMHGYAHNRPCQIEHHPLYVLGAGLEDFEGCERAFSASNEVARLTRHATAFHRHQAIDMHFRHWDTEKLLNIGSFILSNYKQALRLINTFDQVLKDIKTLDPDFDIAVVPTWLEEERKYLEDLRTEPEEVKLEIAYVEALDQLRKEEAGEAAALQMLRRDHPEARRVQPTMRSAQANASALRVTIAEYEDLLNISAGESWTPDSDMYKKTKVYITERRYRLALDHLERLVVQRVFELEKEGLIDTGYKLRTHIGKHLKSRSETIRSAVRKYNTAALSLPTPRPALSFKNVMDNTFLSEFDFLRDTRQDVRSRPWARPGMRILLQEYHRCLRAREEIIRLNLEIRRVRQWVRTDEASLMSAIHATTESGDAGLAYELKRRRKRQMQVHATICQKLDETERLHGYSGAMGQAHTQAPAEANTPTTEPDERLAEAEDGIDASQDAMDALELATERMVLERA